MDPEKKNFKKKQFNALVLHPNFKRTVNDINKVNITLIDPPQSIPVDFSSYTFSNSSKFGIIGDTIQRVKLDPKGGEKKAIEYTLAAYDESKLRYKSLEGDAFFTAHSLVILQDGEYIPVNYLSFYFYTRSKLLKDKHSSLTFSENPESDSNLHYVEDRNSLLLSYPIQGAFYFIDGPLIGGNISSYTVKLVRDMHEHNITPIFFVKNSDSNLVTDNLEELRKKFNSDLHWSFNFLQAGYRTNFFVYTDQENRNNSKVFCYIRAFDGSPQRIEFHSETFQRIGDRITEIMDLIYYLLIVQGNRKNPQIRPIAIAELYAREILKLSNSYNLIKFSGLVPTMNQLRFEK